MSWADELVKSHPEYCFMGYCKQISMSEDFDGALNAIDTESDGLSHAQQLVNEAKDFNSTQKPLDPIWAIIPLNLKEDFSDKILHYGDYQGNNYDIWDYAGLTANNDLLQQWFIFRNLYTSVLRRTE